MLWILFEVVSLFSSQKDGVKLRVKISAFTWNTDDHPKLPRVCILFGSDTKLLNCSNCLSGPPSCVCSSEYAYNMVGDNIIDIIAPVYDEKECQTICKDDDLCTL